MSDIAAFISQNLWTFILFVGLIVIYLFFELSQKKQQAQSLSPQQAIQHTSRGNGVFLDVRGEKAYNEGHITGSVQTSLENLKQGVKKLQRYKKKPIVIYCNTGQTSKSAYELLKEQGFEDLSILRGGLVQWKNDNLPVETAKAKSGQKKKSKQIDNKSKKDHQAQAANTPVVNKEEAMKKVEIYTKDTCPFCIRAKSLLDSKGVQYQEHSLTKDPDIREAMIKRANGRKTVPEVFIDDELIGGFDELDALEKAGQLDSKLNLNEHNKD